MGPRQNLLASILALASLVILSSFLGLAGRWFFSEPLESLKFMGSIWSASLLADIVFTAGTASAGWLAYRLARDHVLLAILAGAAAHWVVYLVSFLLLPDGSTDAGTTDVLSAARFVAMWGFPGLIFAGLAPPVAARWKAEGEEIAPATS